MKKLLALFLIMLSVSQSSSINAQSSAPNTSGTQTAATSQASAPTITSVNTIGTLITVNFSNNHRIQINTTDPTMRYYDENGANVANIPGNIHQAASEAIQQLLNGRQNTPNKIETCAKIIPAIAIPLVLSPIIHPLAKYISSRIQSQMDPYRWEKNCLTALHGYRSDPIRAIVTCPIYKITASAQTLITIFSAVFIGVIIYTYMHKFLHINDKSKQK
jgi:hypothetical protein